MPFEELTARALDVLEQSIATFRAAVGATADQVGNSLAQERRTEGEDASSSGGELGLFAAGRIDSRRFSALLLKSRPKGADVTGILEKAHRLLGDLVRRQGELSVVSVKPGASLREAVAARFADVGRAFGAARVVHLARAGRYGDEEHARFLESFPYSRWNSSERQLSPPFVIEVDGSDLYAGALAEFLDGSQKIVVIVRGSTAPAPLAPLITPGVFVQQTCDPEDLEKLVAFEGPGVAALVPETAARFRHDPAAGSQPWQRLAIDRLPDRESLRPIPGGPSAAQQREGLQQLATLAIAPLAPAAVESPPAAQEGQRPTAVGNGPIDQLAAWILSNTNLEDLE